MCLWIKSHIICVFSICLEFSLKNEKVSTHPVVTCGCDEWDTLDKDRCIQDTTSLLFKHFCAKMASQILQDFCIQYYMLPPLPHHYGCREPILGHSLV